jgi:hypothetical protein
MLTVGTLALIEMVGIKDFIIIEAFLSHALFLLILYSCFCLTLELIWILYVVLALALTLFVLPSISFYTALTDGSLFEDFSCWCCPPVCSAGTVAQLP